VFLVSAVLGAAFNAGFAWLSGGLTGAVVFRFLTGLTLAGVYPVGMKIVASWFRTGLGWRLGVLVGALVLGTASPYLDQAVGAGAVGCVVGGWTSRRMGERRVALVSLVASGTLCVFSGFAQALPPAALVAYLIVWGFFVVSDSPQFSALAARYCPPEYTATAL